MLRLATNGLAAAALALAAAPASAAIVVTITQSGANVVTAFSGTFDLSGLTDAGLFFNLDPRIRADQVFYAGVQSLTNDLRGWGGMAGPGALGPGTSIFTATSAFGDLFGFNRATTNIFFADGFVSGGAVNGGTTFAGQTLASLGLTPGTYVFTAPNDTLTFRIDGAIPEPASWAMLIAGFGLVGAAARRRRIVATN